jgi:hypothetical protein
VSRRGRTDGLTARPVVEYLGNREGHNAISRTGCDDDLFVERIENDSRLVVDPSAHGSGNPHRWIGTHAALWNIPDLEVPAFCICNQARLGSVNLELVAHGHRALDDGLGRRISTGRSIKDKDLASPAWHQKKIVDRVDTNAGSAGATEPYLRIGSAQDSLGRHISICHAIENQDRLISIGQIDFIMVAVDAHLADRRVRAHALDTGLISLNKPERRFLSVGGSAERQNSLRKSAGDHDLIVNPVECEVVHGPAQKRLLALNRSKVRCVFLRRPGEDRDLRMVHSIRHQDFLADGIVGDRGGPAEIHAALALFGAANDS